MHVRKTCCSVTVSDDTGVDVAGCAMRFEFDDVSCRWSWRVEAFVRQEKWSRQMPEGTPGYPMKRDARAAAQMEYIAGRAWVEEKTGKGIFEQH